MDVVSTHKDQDIVMIVYVAFPHDSTVKKEDKKLEKQPGKGKGNWIELGRVRAKAIPQVGGALRAIGKVA